jgi:hypothetical protein
MPGMSLNRKEDEVYEKDQRQVFEADGAQNLRKIGAK